MAVTGTRFNFNAKQLLSDSSWRVGAALINPTLTGRDYIKTPVSITRRHSYTLNRARELEGEESRAREWGYAGIRTTPLSVESLGQGLSKLNLIWSELLLHAGYFYTGVFSNIRECTALRALSPREGMGTREPEQWLGSQSGSRSLLGTLLYVKHTHTRRFPLHTNTAQHKCVV